MWAEAAAAVLACLALPLPLITLPQQQRRQLRRIVKWKCWKHFVFILILSCAYLPHSPWATAVAASVAASVSSMKPFCCRCRPLFFLGQQQQFIFIPKRLFISHFSFYFLNFGQIITSTTTREQQQQWIGCTQWYAMPIAMREKWRRGSFRFVSLAVKDAKLLTSGATVAPLCTLRYYVIFDRTLTHTCTVLNEFSFAERNIKFEQEILLCFALLFGCVFVHLFVCVNMCVWGRLVLAFASNSINFDMRNYGCRTSRYPTCQWVRFTGANFT